MRRSLQNILVLGLTLGFGPSGLVRQAAAEKESTDLALRVFVFNDAQVSDGTLDMAQEIAAKVYRNVGIEITWSGCPAPGEEPAAYPDCHPPFDPSDLFLRILPVSNSGLIRQDDAFGVALIPPDGRAGTMAYVNFDRVDRWTTERIRNVVGRFVSHVPPGHLSALTLGAVMAHELGHLLLGSHSHSNGGIMQADWNQQFLEDAYEGRHGFSSREAQRLQANIRGRQKVFRRRTVTIRSGFAEQDDGNQAGVSFSDDAGGVRVDRLRGGRPTGSER